MTRLALALASVALLGAAPVALAQAPGGGQGRGAMSQERMTAALFEGITLSADQKTKVDAVNAQYQVRLDSARAEMMAARQSGQQIAPERMQAMRTVQTEQRTALRAILTPEQQAQFDKNVAAMPQGGRGMGGGGRPPRD